MDGAGLFFIKENVIYSFRACLNKSSKERAGQQIKNSREPTTMSCHAKYCLYGLYIPLLFCVCLSSSSVLLAWALGYKFRASLLFVCPCTHREAGPLLTDRWRARSWDEGRGRHGRRHVNNVGDQRQQRRRTAIMLQQTVHAPKQDFTCAWTNLKVDPDAEFKVSGIRDRVGTVSTSNAQENRRNAITSR